MYVVAALYHFTRFDDPASLQGPLQNLCDTHGLRGSILIATEGVNGTIAGFRTGIDAALAHIRALPGCAGLEWKESTATQTPFNRMRVRLKREIVTMGQPDVDPASGTGNYVAPDQWNALISAPDVAVIDTRNAYEVSIGTFEGAIDPKTEVFSDFPTWWQTNKAQFAGKRIAMFCTGGIRCEKSTNYLIGQGVEDVFHLKGGILKYLEEVPQQASLWQGECFVFDERVALRTGLTPGTHTLCRACRRPLGEDDRAHPNFVEGVQCLHCVHEKSAEDRDRYRERQRQIDLARARGEPRFERDPMKVDDAPTSDQA